MSDRIDADYLPELNEPLGGTVRFANGDYQFPVELPADKLGRVLEGQAEQHGDEVEQTMNQYVRIWRDDTVYDVGYKPDLDAGEDRAAFIAQRDRYGTEMLAFESLDDICEQAGLGQYETG